MHLCIFMISYWTNASQQLCDGELGKHDFLVSCFHWFIGEWTVGPTAILNLSLLLAVLHSFPWLSRSIVLLCSFCVSGLTFISHLESMNWFCSLILENSHLLSLRILLHPCLLILIICFESDQKYVWHLCFLLSLLFLNLQFIFPFLCLWVPSKQFLQIYLPVQ